MLILKCCLKFKRFKNYGLWVSIAALIPMLYEAFGGKSFPGNYNQIVNLILSILVILGILNNPTTANKGYFDDEIEK